jgi:hypothetical protein
MLSETSILKDVTYMIQAVGFPIAVAAFLLWRLNGKLGAFVTAAQEITEGLRELSAEFREHRSTSKTWVDELRQEMREGRR